MDSYKIQMNSEIYVWRLDSRVYETTCRQPHSRAKNSDQQFVNMYGQLKNSNQQFKYMRGQLVSRV